MRTRLRRTIGWAGALVWVLAAGCGGGGGASAPPAGVDDADALLTEDASTVADDASSVEDTGPDASSDLPPCPAGSARGQDDLCWVEEPSDPASIDTCAHPAAGAADAVHVDAGSTAEAPDGSAAAPFPALGAGLAAAAGAGLDVWVHPGTYAGGVDVPGGVQVHGTCPAEVLVEGPADGVAVRFDSVSGAGLHGVAVREAAVGVQVLLSVDVSLSRLHVHDTQRGVDAQSASLVLTASRVEAVGPDADAVTQLVPGYGVSATAQSLVVVDGLTIEQTSRTGLTVSQTELTVRATAIRTAGGSNVHVESGSRASLDAVTIEQAQLTEGAGAGVALLSADDVWIRGSTLSDNPGANVLVEASGPLVFDGNTVTGGGEGLRLQLHPAGATITGSSFTGCAGSGIVVLESGAAIGPGNVLTDVATHASGDFGDAVHVVDTEDLSIVGNTIDGAARLGVLLSDGVHGVVEGNDIRTTGGAGFWAQVGGRATVSGNTVEDTTGYGIGALGSVELDVSTNTIRDVAEDPATGAADGIVIAGGSAAKVTENLLPIPGGFVPNPLRAAILVDQPGLPGSGFLELAEGTAVVVAGNTVEQATFGVVVQGASAGVVVDVDDDNDFGGAVTPSAVDAGLEPPIDVELSTESKLPIPGGFLEL